MRTSVLNTESTNRLVRPVALAVAALTGLALFGFLPSVAAHAVTDDGGIHIDPYYTSNDNYQSLNVDVSVAKNADKAQDLDAVAALSEVRVTVNRADGSSVVKVSKPGASLIGTIKSGGGVTTPFVITPRGYDEAGSSSWVKPDAVWTLATEPVSIDVEFRSATGVLLSAHADAPDGGFSAKIGVPYADMIPTIDAARANFRNQADYKGVTVDFALKNFEDAKQIIVSVEREGAAPVVKTSKAKIVDAANVRETTRYALTAPIVIQQGTYNEAGSTSWVQPGAVWTPKSVPTAVTITVTRENGPDVVQRIASIGGSIEGVMPVATESVEVTVPENSTDPFEISVPADATNVAVNLGVVDDGQVTVPVDVTVRTTVGVDVTIPAGTVVTAADADWDGVITAPTVVSDVKVPDTKDGKTATVSLAIEVGSATTSIHFDQPVKLVLAGQAGKQAGFVQGGVFTAIDTECTSATPSLSTGECWMDSGDDLVIWTTHFTTFVSYTATSTGGTGGTGGDDDDDDDELADTGAADASLLMGGAGALALLGAAALVLAERKRRRA